MKIMLVQQAKELIGEERDFFANAANLSSFIFLYFNDLNWAGVYLRSGDELVLGPFQGKPACVRIKWGKGVCGTAAMMNKTVVVANVHDFPGHIACDAASNSEIVIPLVYKNEVYGVLDIDSPKVGRFTDAVKSILEELAGILTANSDIDRVIKYNKS